MTIVEAIRQIEQPRGVAVIGSTDAIIRGMFGQQDAHVIAWRRWKWLEEQTADYAMRSQFLLAALLRDQRRGALNDY